VKRPFQFKSLYSTDKYCCTDLQGNLCLASV